MEISSVLSLAFYILFVHSITSVLADGACKNRCGNLPVRNPLGTGNGCGSPRFSSSVSCINDQLTLTTHTGSYPITSISYPTSTLIITPPCMSTCSSMQSSPNFGLDWNGPFQLGSSVFILLSCQSSSSSLTYKGSPLCDSTSSYLCGALYPCPAAISFGISLYSSNNSCCVFSPANLGPTGELDLQGLKCAGYLSVVSLGDFPTDPNRWQYGVSLKFGQVVLDNYNLATACKACEKSNGVCGYTPPYNYFVCVCNNGVNTSSVCNGQVDLWSSANPDGGFHLNRSVLGCLLGLFMLLWV